MQTEPAKIRKTRSTERITVTCAHCGKVFTVPNNRKDTAKFCSRKCTSSYGLVKKTSTCLVCNTEFEHIACRANKAKYCSRACYYKAMHRKGSVTVSCEHCGKEFLASPSENRRYCSRACVNKVIKSEWVASKTTVRKNMLRRGMLRVCEGCGYSAIPEILGIHHRDRKPENNTPENLAVLCPMCHSLEHMKHEVHKSS
jgi:hypothetical protein